MIRRLLRACMRSLLKTIRWVLRSLGVGIFHLLRVFLLLVLRLFFIVIKLPLLPRELYRSYQRIRLNMNIASQTHFPCQFCQQPILTTQQLNCFNCKTTSLRHVQNRCPNCQSPNSELNYINCNGCGNSIAFR